MRSKWLLCIGALWAPLALAGSEIVGDEIDQDGDGTEICYADADFDGYRSTEGTTVVSKDLDCTDAGEARATDPGGDCRDDNGNIHPDAPEQIGDGVDQDCDGSERCYVDEDNDGYAPIDFAVTISADEDCDDPGEATNTTPQTDCDDTNADVNPDQVEIPNNDLDEDCDGVVEITAVEDSGEDTDTDTDEDPDEDPDDEEPKDGCSTVRATGMSALLVLGAMVAVGWRRRR